MFFKPRAFTFNTLALTLPLSLFSGAAFAQQVEGSALEATVDTSLLSLFLEASLVVQVVMIGLIIASVWCWAIIIDKSMLFVRTKRATDRFEQGVVEQGPAEHGSGRIGQGAYDRARDPAERHRGEDAATRQA